MKRLNANEANNFLRPLSLKIGKWNQITSVSDLHDTESQGYTKYQAPHDSSKLFTFSEHVAGWIPTGDWKILQIDNSTSLNVVLAAPIGRMLFCLDDLPNTDTINKASLLFEFGSDKRKNSATELLISNLIHLLLLFECHAQITSSACHSGQFLSIQDRFVYFMSGEGGKKIVATDMLKNYERNPTFAPQWIVDIIAADQEKY